MSELSAEARRAVSEKVERINAELEGLPALGLGFVLVICVDDWATVPSGPLVAFTVSSLALQERAELFEHLANEIRLGRNTNFGDL